VKPYYEDEWVTLFHGDCLDVLRTLPDASVDSVVTDPPYGLEFMGKDWDRFAPRDRKNATVWDGRRTDEGDWKQAAADRSGKGGGGPSYRSQHKGAKRCTLCGRRAFSGSPCECPEPEWVVEHRQEAPSAMLAFQAWCLEWSRECYRVLKPGGHMLAFGGTRTSHRLACAIEDAGFEIRDSIAWLYGSGFPKSLDVSKAIDRAAGVERPTYSRPAFGNTFSDDNGTTYGQAIDDTPITPDAERWQGWGTAMKPAHEPVVVARKPLIGTVAQNILAHGTGALNVDGCRVEGEPRTTHADGNKRTRNDGPTMREGFGVKFDATPAAAGRWPANVVLDEHQAAALDEQSGETVSPTGPVTQGGMSGYDPGENAGTRPRNGFGVGYADIGGASRFFYTAKAGSDERPTHGGTSHPTVKPLALMRWLVRLVTPPGGTCLEPFAGSGTTAEACLLERFHCIAIEREADYLPLILQRIHRRRDPIAYLTNAGHDLGLFGELA